MHSLLERQLKRVGLQDETTLPDASAWREFLERVDRAYTQMEQDRYLLERSLGVSSREMEEINGRLDQKNRELERVNEFFRVTLDNLLEAVQKGAEQTELLALLRQVKGEFRGLD